MLQELITEHRGTIIERALRSMRQRADPGASDELLESGIPSFLSQVADALTPLSRKQMTRRDEGLELDAHGIGFSASLHGQQLQAAGFSIAQVVHSYGDVCQVVTDLMSELGGTVDPEDFRIFNRCLDDAIAASASAFSRQSEQSILYEGTERLGVLSHELRNLIHTAIISFDVLKRGTVGLAGSTGALHSRCLASLHALVDRSIAQVRLDALKPALERICVATFMDEMRGVAELQAEGYGLEVRVGTIAMDVEIEVDRALLASAVSNLLLNAFKFTKGHGHTVTFSARAGIRRVMLDVSDECGGLAPGLEQHLFQPFVRGGVEHSGLGLGLAIARSAVRANAGEISVRDIPGTGCVFTIDLPRQAWTPSPQLGQEEHGHDS